MRMYPSLHGTIYVLSYLIILTLTTNSAALNYNPPPLQQISLPKSKHRHLQITALTSITSPSLSLSPSDKSDNSNTSLATHAHFSCLRLPTPFSTYPTIGASTPLILPLSSHKNMSFVTLPAHSTEKWHNPPMPMWFVLLRGRAVVRTYDPTAGGSPNEYTVSKVGGTDQGDEDASVDIARKQQVTVEPGGVNQFILALDVLGRGHWTDYPSDEETWALQIPLEEGWETEIGRWDVVGDGACI